MRHGLTMVETLVALSLLSALVLAIASWTQVAARTAQTAAIPVQWQAAARSVLQLIHDDLLTGDFLPTRRGQREKRAEVNGNALRIQTRATIGDREVGRVFHRYECDLTAGELRLEQQADGGSRTTRLLLDRVREWRCEIDQEQRLLTVTIACREGPVVFRRYPLP